MKAIVITGSVGTGKTTLARKLSKALGYAYVDVNKVISKYKVAEGYDSVRRCKIVNVGKLKKMLVKNLKGNVVIDSHLSHNLSKRYVDLCVVTKCSLKVLGKRLKKRR